MIDAQELERRTGWRVVAHEIVASTNDEAAVLRDAGIDSRVVVVADSQLAGRGRGGRRFESPAGGLYASLLVTLRPIDLPAPLIAAVAVALAEAIEAVAPVRVRIKWPNDLWIEGRKVAGILTEASLSASSPAPSSVTAIVGVGVNLARVPDGLDAATSARTTALDLHAERPTRREDVLAEFLVRLHRRIEDLARDGARAGLESDYRARLAMRGEPVTFHAGSVPVEGVLVDVSMDRGLCVRDRAGVVTWWPTSVVRDVRPAGSERGDPPVTRAR